MSNTCPNCGCSNPADFDDSSGLVVCTGCGTVVNESHIVSEITFGENSAGAATVQGSRVGAGQTHASTGGRYRSGTSIESREHTIAEGTTSFPCYPPPPFFFLDSLTNMRASLQLAEKSTTLPLSSRVRTIMPRSRSAIIPSRSLTTLRRAARPNWLSPVVSTSPVAWKNRRTC